MADLIARLAESPVILTPTDTTTSSFRGLAPTVPVPWIEVIDTGVIVHRTGWLRIEAPGSQATVYTGPWGHPDRQKIIATDIVTRFVDGGGIHINVNDPDVIGRGHPALTAPRTTQLIPEPGPATTQSTGPYAYPR